MGGVMSQVSQTVHLKASADDVWKMVGGFQALPQWHPAVLASKVEEIDGVEHRRLDLGGGASLLEKNMGEGEEKSYGYRIIDAGPLPIKEYNATITVTPTEEGCTVVWSSTFEGTADGASDVITGIYKAGFDNLKKMFGG